jgi:hypothetical protein
MTRAPEPTGLVADFSKAYCSGDVHALRAVLAPDARIWHNYDRVSQTVEENLAMLAAFLRRGHRFEYHDIRRFVVSPGIIVQTTTPATAPRPCSPR